ncbi:peptidoglycan D,D-transpeptidase FtsI family protein [Paenibacillus sp. HJGM_3]|uniref:peptidoglycan D,D-transpeptidase FtsI family protein n=1 Tax=Paenibacillus sp. HJGM_3 TaxID=3379816 RepID=UPI00385E66AC
MTNKDPAKEEIAKNRHFSFRLNFFFFGIFLLFSILIVRLALLQFVEGKALAEEETRMKSMHHSIPPIRGTIFDRTGAYPIAESTSTQSLFYSIEPGKKDKEPIIEMAKKLEQVFTQYGDPKKPLSAQEIIKRMDVGYDLDKNPTKDPSYYSVPRRIKADMTNSEIAYLSEHRDQYPGFEIQEESIRHYNDKTIAVQLVGYLKSFSAARNKDTGLEFYRQKAESTDPTVEYLDTEEVGFDGIEYLFQDELRGKNGLKSYPVNAAQKIVGPVTLTKPEKGNNLFLTIDSNVQLETEKAITEHLAYIRSVKNDVWRYAPNATTGYAVAMEVDTGNVIAMASMPDYDPNIWHGGINNEDYKSIQYQYLNGAISEVYANYPDPKERAKHPTSLVYLGSTIKPLSVLIGLKEGLFTANETYYDTGAMTFGKDNTVIHNSGGTAWGYLNAWQAIWRSSNTYMSEMIGLRLYNKYKGDIKVWDDYMKQFGLGVKTGSGLRYESAGIADYKYEAEKASSQSALVRASWGQMGKYTTLQLAQYAAMLGNRGKRMKPNFVSYMTTYDMQPIKKFEPEVLNEVQLPKDYWDTIQRGMLLVNKDGFDGVTYSVAAKTGTSTQSIARKEIDNAVFIAYAPADKPKIAVAVVVPEGGYGAYGAGPIARRILDAYDREYGMYGTPNPNAGVK